MPSDLGVRSGVCGATGVRLSSDRGGASTGEGDPRSVQDRFRAWREGDETSGLDDCSQVSLDPGSNHEEKKYLYNGLPN